MLWQYGIRLEKFGDLLDWNFISFYVLHDDMKASCQRLALWNGFVKLLESLITNKT